MSLAKSYCWLICSQIFKGREKTPVFLTVCVSRWWAGVDSLREQKKPEARKMLENAAESHQSAARFVGRLFCEDSFSFSHKPYFNSFELHVLSVHKEGSNKKTNTVCNYTYNYINYPSASTVGQQIDFSFLGWFNYGLKYVDIFAP